MVYPIGKRLVPPIYQLWLGEVKGIENIPKDKPFIIAANHSSYYDVLLPSTLVVPLLNKKVHAFSNSYYWKNFITKWWLDLGESIPVFVEKEKNSKIKNETAFKKAMEYLKKGDIILIFPEGSRSNDGKLKKAYNGAARLALSAKVPVLPFGIIGASKVMPKGKMFPRFTKCKIKIGKLVYFDRYHHKKITGKMLDEATKMIMKKIAELINQEYNY